MKINRTIFVLLCLIGGIEMNAQSTTGITHIPDTSFSVSHEYAKLKKNYPQIVAVENIQSKQIKEKKDIVYCTDGDRKLLLDAFYPKTKQKQRTAIMIIHGGGWRSGNRMQHHPLAQRLAELGYVCFTPEYRLSTEALYPTAVYDLKSALRWIRNNAKQYKIDTSRIVVMGFSAGGELATFLGVTNGNKEYEGKSCSANVSSNVNAVIDLDGTLSFVHTESGEGDDSKKPSAATLWFGYSKKENPELWKQASPLTYAGKNTPPVLFINSSVDRMHAGRNDFMKVLKENGIQTEVKTFNDAPHSFPLFHPWFDPMVTYIDDFLKRVFVHGAGKVEP